MTETFIYIDGEFIDRVSGERPPDVFLTNRGTRHELRYSEPVDCAVCGPSLKAYYGVLPGNAEQAQGAAQPDLFEYGSRA